MNEKIDLIKSNGTGVTGDVICFLEDNTTGRRFIYYTLNEVVGDDANATVKIYVGKVNQSNDLNAPISDEEWIKLKGIMGDVLKDNTDDTIKYLPISEITEKSVVDEKVIAMPTSYDYINKHRAVYYNVVGEVAIEAVPEISEESLNAPIEENTFETSVPAVEETNPVVETELEQKEPVVTEAPVEEPTLEATSIVVEQANNDLTPIDINEIESKYAEMINNINQLKEKELEAARRYNATLELSAMHNEQHASYVQNEQQKEETVIETTPVVEEIPSEPVEVENNITDVEPTPVEPTPIETTSEIGSMETNWFDMPIQE